MVFMVGVRTPSSVMHKAADDIPNTRRPLDWASSAIGAILWREPVWTYEESWLPTELRDACESIMADQFEDYTPDPEGHVICAVQPLGATTFRVLSDGTYSALLVKYTGSIGSAAIVTASRSLSESIDSKAENLGLELIVLRATDQAVSFWQKMGQLGLRSGDPDPKLNSYAARYSAAPKNDKEKQLLEEYGLLAWLEVPDDCRHMYKSLRP
eukprot:s2822_g1.t1